MNRPNRRVALWKWFVDHPLPETWGVRRLSRTVTERALTVLAHEPDLETVRAAAADPRLPLPVMVELSTHPHWRVHQAVTVNPACPADLLEYLAATDEHVGPSIITNPNVTPAALVTLAQKGPWFIRRDVAHHLLCPPWLLERLVEDESASVRAAALSNPGCPPGAKFMAALT